MPASRSLPALRPMAPEITHEVSPSVRALSFIIADDDDDQDLGSRTALEHSPMLDATDRVSMPMEFMDETAPDTADTALYTWKNASKSVSAGIPADEVLQAEPTGESSRVNGPNEVLGTNDPSVPRTSKRRKTAVVNNDEADLTLSLESTNDPELVASDDESDEFAVDSIIDPADIDLNVVDVDGDWIDVDDSDSDDDDIDDDDIDNDDIDNDDIDNDVIGDDDIDPERPIFGKSYPLPQTSGKRKRGSNNLSNPAPPSAEYVDGWLLDADKALPIVQRNVERFAEAIKCAIRHLCAYVRTPEAIAVQEKASYVELPIAVSMCFFLRRWEPDVLSNIVLEAIPIRTQSILGQTQLQPLDLLACPYFPRLRLWGVYVDLASSGDIHRPGKKFKQPPKPLKPEGVYVGSGTARVGINGRIRKHALIAKTGINKDSSAHYSVICRPEVTPNFRVLAWTQVHSSPGLVEFIEGLLMWYLDTLSEARNQHKYTPPITWEHYNHLRGAVETELGRPLPSFRAFSLNRAWPLKQGFQNRQRKAHARWAQTHPDVCGNPKCRVPRPRGRGTKGAFRYFKEKSRCRACACYRYAHGHDPTAPRRGHAAWLADGNADVCGNCGLSRNSNFTFWQEESRCVSCYSHRAKTGMERQILVPSVNPQRVDMGRLNHERWVAAGNPDVCKNCGTVRPETDYPQGSRKSALATAEKSLWRGWRENLTCPTCHAYFNRNKEERPKERFVPTVTDHRSWLAAGNADVCGNCQKPRPTTGGKTKFHSFCENARCPPCYTYTLRNNGKERPSNLWVPTKKDHTAWLADGNDDVCGNCGTQRVPKKYFKGFCENARCDNCYAWRKKNNGEERPT